MPKRSAITPVHSDVPSGKSKFIEATVLAPPSSHSITSLDSIAGARVSFTAGGLIIGQSLSPEEWTAILERLHLIHHTYHNNLSDLLAYGRREFGTEFVNERLTQLQFALPDVQRADAIGQLSFDLRSTHRLTSEHFYVLGRLLPEKPKEQAKWAAIAVTEQLSALALKRSLESPDGPRLITDAQLALLQGKHSGQPVLQGVCLEVTRWVNQLGGEEKLAKSPAEVRRAFCEEVAPIARLYQDISATLE